MFIRSRLGTPQAILLTLLILLGGCGESVTSTGGSPAEAPAFVTQALKLSDPGPEGPSLFQAGLERELDHAEPGDRLETLSRSLGAETRLVERRAEDFLVEGPADLDWMAAIGRLSEVELMTAEPPVRLSASPLGSPSDLTSSLTPLTYSVRLEWVDNASDEKGFEIWQSKDDGPSTLLTKVGTTQKKTLTVGPGAYSFRVRAYNTIGFSDFSNQSPLGVPVLSIPAVPTNPAATSDPQQVSIRLTWQDNADDNIGVEIWRSEAGNPFSLLRRYTGSTPAYTDTQLLAVTQYQYKLRAYNGAGTSSFSDIATATSANVVAPTQPLNLAGRLDKGKVVLTWTLVTNQTGVEIWRAGPGAAFTLLRRINDRKRKNYSDAAPMVGENRYQIRAFNQAGPSPFSATVSVIVPPPPPPAAPGNLTGIYDAASSTATLSWEDRSFNEKGFELWARAGNGAFLKLLSTASNATSAVYTLPAVQLHTFQVRAFTDYGYSEFTPAVVLPSPPGGLVRLDLIPQDPRLPVGDRRQFTAYGVFGDGSRINFTQAVTWSSSVQGVATVSNALADKGTLSGHAVGETQIVATEPSSGIHAATTASVFRYREVGRLPIDDVVVRLKASPDGSRLYVLTPNALLVVEVASRQIVGSVPVGFATGMDLSSDGRLLLVSSLTDSGLRAIDTQFLNWVSIPVGAVPTLDVAIDSDQKAYALASNKLLTIDLETLTHQQTLQDSRLGYAAMLAIDRPGKNLIAGVRGYSPSSLYRYNVATGSPVFQQEMRSPGSNGRSLRMSPTGTAFMFLCGGGNDDPLGLLGYWAYLYSSSALQSVLEVFSIGTYPLDAAYSPDGEVLYGINGSHYDRRIYVATTSDGVNFTHIVPALGNYDDMGRVEASHDHVFLYTRDEYHDINSQILFFANQ